MNALRIAAFFSLLLILRSDAQLPVAGSAPPIKGTFYVSVDDECTIYVNGKNIYHAAIGESRSPETELKVGDHIVVQLLNKTDGRHFLFVFASSDGRTIFSFKHHEFKVVPDINVTDFTPQQFAGWTLMAKEEKQKKAKKLPIQNFSEFMWGDLDKCIIAGAVAPEMIYQKP
jgi:hypothetical protein